MALAPYIFGSDPRGAANPDQPAHRRNRLRKRNIPSEAKMHRSQDPRIANELQSCLDAPSDDAAPTRVCSTQPRIQPLRKIQPAVLIDDTLSIYSNHSMDSALFQRRRSKTPVFFVGQLERKSTLDRAQALADDYRAVLPLRLKSSFVELERSKTPKRIRKIKCQLSLRDLVKEHEHHSPPPSTPGSDVDTLVGSPAWPRSPSDSEFDKNSLPPLDEVQELYTNDDGAPLPPIPDLNNDIGLKICADLLTNELASSLLQHQPPEPGMQASGLQILLLIEAYETVQQRVRQLSCESHGTGKNMDHVRSTEMILEHWLQVLYAVYDRSVEKKQVNHELDGGWTVRSSHIASQLRW